MPKTMPKPKISIVIPYHDIPQTAFFLGRLLKSIEIQNFKDYEIVLEKKGRMGVTYNSGIQKSKGELIKLMGMDDYFFDPSALGDIVEAFDAIPEAWWMAAPCLHDNGQRLFRPHTPSWNEHLYQGYNTVGGFACISIRNKDVPLIDEDLDWVVDIDWYWRIYQQHGLPYVPQGTNVVIGIGEHQTTNTLSDEQKLREHKLTNERYGK